MGVQDFDDFLDMRVKPNGVLIGSRPSDALDSDRELVSRWLANELRDRSHRRETRQIF
jgi:hypothetical protein